MVCSKSQLFGALVVVGVLAPSSVQGFSIHQSTISSTTPRGRLTTRLSMAVGGGTSSQGGSSTAKTAPVVKDPEKIRNVAFCGHSHSGKTALVEWMMYDEKAISKQPTAGVLSLDSDPVEAARHSSIFSHFARIPHGSANYLLEVSDTPWGDFPSDALAAVDGADAAVLVVSAADSVQAGTVNAYHHCVDNGIPMLLAMSKMDRPFVQHESVLEDLQVSLEITPVPLQVVVSQGEDEFAGVVPLLRLNEQGQVIPNDNFGLDEGLNEAWMVLEEAVAMTDDEILMEYLEESRLDPQVVISGLQTAVRQGKILPLVYTSAENDLGVMELMDAMVAVLPNPVEMRQEAVRVACENDQGKCALEPGVETGFAARVLHTTVDSFGSLSVLRVITNDRSSSSSDKKQQFDPLPNEAVILRTGEKIKMPAMATSFGLCGKERLPLADASQVVPGDVIAVPKLSESVRTNDILAAPSSVQEDESEIFIERSMNCLTPLSRPVETVALMTCATVTLPEAGGGKKSKGRSAGGGGAGDDKLLSALHALAREDLAVRVEHDVASGKLLLHCMSSDHLNVLSKRLKDRYDLDVELGRPPVQYRETLAKSVKNVEGRHKKQSGGSGQFGVCYISMDPLEEGAGIEFESQIKGGAISKPFISSVEKGVMEQLQSGGPLGGYPVTDVRVTLIDGKMHSVDSKDVAFQSAGRLAVRAALERGKTRLLEPMESVVFVIDEKLQGEIGTIVARGNGYVTSTHPSANGRDLEVEATLPTAGIADVSDALRAASGGEAQYTSSFSHYQPVPESEVERIVGGDDDSKLTP